MLAAMAYILTLSHLLRYWTSIFAVEEAASRVKCLGCGVMVCHVQERTGWGVRFPSSELAGVEK